MDLCWFLVEYKVDDVMIYVVPWKPQVSTKDQYTVQFLYIYNSHNDIIKSCLNMNNSLGIYVFLREYTHQVHMNPFFCITFTIFLSYFFR